MGVDRLRPLNQLRRAAVELDANGLPAFITEHGQRHAITGYQDRWRIDEEWWRDPIVRTYWQVHLANGGVRTLCQDEINQEWNTQSY